MYIIDFSQVFGFLLLFGGIFGIAALLWGIDSENERKKKMTPHAKEWYNKLSPTAQKAIDALIDCNEKDIDDLAKIMAPRIEYVHQRTMTDAERHAVMLLYDLQGKP